MRALVLSGGNAKGSYQVGVLKKWLLEDYHEYQIIIGTSIGSLNGGYLAQAPIGKLNTQLRKLIDLWEGLSTSDVYQKWFCCELAALWKSSVYKTEGVRTIIKDNIDPSLLRDSTRIFRSVYVSWRTGKVHVGTEKDDDIREKMYASASLPVFFEPALVNGELCTDGGVREVAFIGHAIEMGASDVDVILCSNPEEEEDWSSDLPGVLGYALRVVDIMASEVLLNDIKICQERNKLAKLMAVCKREGVELPDCLESTGDLQEVNLRIIKPSRPLGDPFDFSTEQTVDRIRIGYEDAHALEV